MYLQSYSTCLSYLSTLSPMSSTSPEFTLRLTCTVCTHCLYTGHSSVVGSRESSKLQLHCMEKEGEHTLRTQTAPDTSQIFSCKLLGAFRLSFLSALRN